MVLGHVSLILYVCVELMLSQPPSTVTSTGQESVSKYVDQVFDSAYNLTQAAGDLTNVRWGRIDYLNVTAITTKWAVWS